MPKEKIFFAPRITYTNSEIAYIINRSASMQRITRGNEMRIFLNKVQAKAKRVLRSSSIGLTVYKLRNSGKSHFTCPICKYHGPFADVNSETGLRKHSACPKCGSLERHRLQYLVIEKIVEKNKLSQMSILHFAPEPFFQLYFRKIFKIYTSADLVMKNVDYKADLLKLPFEDNFYDFVFASHVLEHIKDDERALSEIRRILKPNGIAVLPVPIIAYQTVEYPEPNPHEANHVRAPGPDYFEKYSLYFKTVEKYSSNDFPSEYQVFVYEDRTCWPNYNMPLRPAMRGDKHLDIVPVCYA